MTPDEPINFDFSPEPPVDPGAQGGASAGGTAASGAGGADGVDGAITGAIAPDQSHAAARAGASAPLPPIPDFRASSYPFAMTSRFQAQAVIPAPKASPRQRLLYGILAAVVSVMVFKNIVTWQGGAGYAITVAGVFMYSESKRRAKAMAAAAARAGEGIKPTSDREPLLNSSSTTAATQDLYFRGGERV